MLPRRFASSGGRRGRLFGSRARGDACQNMVPFLRVRMYPTWIWGARMHGLLRRHTRAHWPIQTCEPDPRGIWPYSAHALPRWSACLKFMHPAADRAGGSFQFQQGVLSCSTSDCGPASRVGSCPPTTSTRGACSGQLSRSLSCSCPSLSARETNRLPVCSQSRSVHV